MKIFLDGNIIEADNVLRETLTPGVLKAEGVFETMRVVGGEVRDLPEHLDRLFNGLRFLKMRGPATRKSLTRSLKNVLKQNDLIQARARLAVWRKSGKTHAAIVCQPFQGYPAKKYEKGFHTVVSGVLRAKTKDAHIKSLNYEIFRRAFMEARAGGYDEAVLLNHRKEVVEGSRTNIFFVRKGALFTPSVKCGCLNGITRRQVIRCAKETGISFKVVQAPVRELLKADEAFCTNSLMGIMPLTAVSGASIGSGSPGPVTKKLSGAYRTIPHSSCPS